MSQETHDAQFHSRRDDRHAGPSRRTWANAFWLWWQTGPPDPPPCRCFTASTCSCVEQQAFKAGWIAAKATAGDESVDGVHPRDAREKA